MSPTKSTARKTTTKSAKASKVWTAEERAAMRERAQELKASTDRAAGEKALLAKIAEMPEPERTMAARLRDCRECGFFRENAVQGGA